MLTKHLLNINLFAGYPALYIYDILLSHCHNNMMLLKYFINIVHITFVQHLSQKSMIRYLNIYKIILIKSDYPMDLKLIHNL